MTCLRGPNACAIRNNLYNSISRKEMASTSGNTDRARGVRQGTTTRNNGQHNNNKDYFDEP